MKRLLIILLAFAVLVPPAVAAPAPAEGEPPGVRVPTRPVPPRVEAVAPHLQAGIPPIGQAWGAGALAVDLDNLPVPGGLAHTGFAMDLDARKRDVAIEWVNSLTDEQRARIGQMLAGNRSAALDGLVAEMAAARETGQAPGGDVEVLEVSLAEFGRWQGAISAGLAQILTPEQYELYQESLLPAPDASMPAAPESESDCYYAYYYGYYAYLYSYYFYYYAYYTYATTTDPFAYLTYHLAYNSYVQSYYGYLYSYYAYVYYYNATYAYYARYFMRHAEGFAYYGRQMAYSLYTWTSSNSYSYTAYVHGYYAYFYADIADGYAGGCYSSSSGSDGQEGRIGSLTEAWSSDLPDSLPVAGARRDAPYPEMAVDPSSLPVPEELAEAGLGTALDWQKMQAGSEWVRSLTDGQRARIRAVLAAERSPALERAGAAVAQAGVAADRSGLDGETLDAAVAEVKRWQRAVSDGLAEILTPEQYELYQESLLPAPDALMPAAPESQSDCYAAYYYGVYAHLDAYYYYYYAYYAYASNTDPYLYDNYLFGYYAYRMAYHGYVYSYYAYLHYHNATYGYYAHYYTRHAEGFLYYGYPFAYMTYTWVGDTYSYNAYYYAYYGYYYVNLADNYAWPCYNESPQVILNVPAVQQTQTQWCWAATTQGILSYYGASVAQCTIANYNWSRSDCCTNPSSTNCNQPTGMYGGTVPPGLQACLNHWGVSSTAVWSELSWSAVQSEINAGRPAVARWGWYSCSLNCGHFLTVRGYDLSANNVYYIDPGDGAYHTSTYSSFYDNGTHKWTHSLDDVAE